MRHTITLRKDRQLSCRVSELCKELLACEQRHTGESEGDIVERYLLQHMRSREALQIVRRHMSTDPMVRAIIEAMQVPGRLVEEFGPQKGPAPS